MKQNIISLTEKLITIRTIPTESEALSDALALVTDFLADFTIEFFEKEGVKSILVYKEKVRPESFRLILNGHLDIIPGKDSQYEPRIEDDRLYGVGAMDMKANLVVAMHAFKAKAKDLSYPIAMQIVTDEEVGGFLGTKYQIESGVKGDFVLSTEPTNFDIVHQAKGVLWLKIKAVGRTGHGAYPWQGDNAVLKINYFLEQLRALFPSLDKPVWQTTCNVASVNTVNQTLNKIPDTCEVLLDIRFVPGEELVLDRIRDLLPEGCELEVLANEPALNTKEGNIFVQKLLKVTEQELGKKTVLRGAQGSSDARHYRHINVEGIEFGPIGDGIGADDEWVSLSSLDNYYNILVKFMETLDD